MFVPVKHDLKNENMNNVLIKEEKLFTSVFIEDRELHWKSGSEDERYD